MTDIPSICARVASVTTAAVLAAILEDARKCKTLAELVGHIEKVSAQLSGTDAKKKPVVVDKLL